MKRQTFKAQHKLVYPVNVGRNIARDAAISHFIFASDIELYPSPGIVPKFLQMIANEPGDKLPKHRIFPIAIYEVAEDTHAPDNKTELVQMLHSKKARRFHANICATCHSVPDNAKWESTPESPGKLVNFLMAWVKLINFPFPRNVHICKDQTNR